MKKFLILNLILLCFCNISGQAAEEPIPSAISLASLEGEPSSIVHGCISVITGDYVESHTDLVIPGVEPLAIQRYYSSASFSDRSLGHGWGLNHHGYLDVAYIEPYEVTDEPNHIFPFPRTVMKGDYTYSVMTDENGVSMQFDCFSYPDKDRYLTADISALKLGVTNCSRGVISGKTSWKNTKINYSEKKFHAVTGSGSHYEFDKHEKNGAKKDIHRLLSIKKPNGNKIVYDYDSNNLTDITYKNMGSSVLNSLKIIRTKIRNFKDEVQLFARDGRHVSYSFTEKKSDGKKLEVKSTCAPLQTYFYSAEEKHETSKIIKKERANECCLSIDYYKKERCNVGPEEIEIDSHKDLRMNRVKSLAEPVGTTDELIPTCRLIYETGDKGKGSKKALAGKTKVYDALNHKTTYSYNKDHRLTCIAKFTGEDIYKHYSSEKLLWGDNDDRKHRTQLRCRTFENGGGQILFARQFNYDDNGNIIKDHLAGNLTGGHPQSVVMNKDGFPSKKGENECYEKEYKYSIDGMNLMEWETDGKTRIEYVYHPGTDLLSAQYLIIGKKKADRVIRKRCFYDYDINGALCCEILDDGCEYERMNLQGVTERKIKTIINTKNPPVGLPEIIEEKYYDPETSLEILLHKTVNKYDNKGFLKMQKHFGSDGTLAYKLQWDYDDMGNVLWETNALGEEIIRTYDAKGNKRTEKGPCQDYDTTYDYDAANRLISETKVSLEGTFVKRYSYDTLNRLKTTTDIYGNTTTYDYDEFGRLTTTIYPAYQDENGQPTSLKVFKDYNAMGNVTLQHDACGAITKTRYTIRGKPYQIENPDGTIELNEYDVAGNLVRSVAKNGTVTYIDNDYQSRPKIKKVCDANGALLYTTECEYNAFHLLSETDPEGHKKIYRYDRAGRLIETQKNERLTTYAYDALGRQSETREHFDGGYIAHIKVYDYLNRVVEERTEDDQGQLFSKVKYKYDADGNRIQSIVSNQAGEAITRTRYNAHQEPLETIDPLGQKTVYAYTVIYLSQLSQYVPCISITDPSGNVTTTIKDAMGHVVSVERKNPFGQTLQLQEYKYDSNGCKVQSLETVFTPGKPQRQVITRWKYNTSGQVTDLIEAVGTPEQKHTQYIYKQGRQESIIKPGGVSIEHRYDSLGRLFEYFASDESVHYKYTYDRNDNLRQVDDLVHGRVSKREYNAFGQVTDETLANGLVLRYVYDRIGRLASLTLPDETQAAYAYDPLRLKEVARLDAKGRTLYSHRYETYDLMGNITEATLIGRAGRLTHQRDLLGRTLSIETPCWNEKIKDYDPAGNLKSRILTDVMGAVSCEYTYNDLHQLESEQGVKEHRYVSDSLYNRVEKDGRLHQVNALNQLKSDSGSVYEYDFSGRMFKKTTGSSVIEYGYDALDRLISVTQGNTQTRYYYDAENRRLSKTHAVRDAKGKWAEQSSERYLYQGKNEIGACGADGRFTQLRILGNGKGAELGAAVAIELEGKAYAPVHDHCGSVMGLIDKDTGKVVEAYRYTAFGEEQIFDCLGYEQEQALNPWRYASKRADEETGFVYFGRRYYDPIAGRWITPDPIGFEGGPNLYAYVWNNPLSLFDAYGLSAESDVFSQPEELKAPQGLFNRMVHRTGEFLRFLGDHVIPIPGVRDVFSYVGHRMMTSGTHENFQPMCRNGHSENGNLHRPEMNDKVRFVLINGIMNNLHDCHAAALRLSDMLGGANVHYTYNSSHGMMLDLFECLAQKLGIPTNSVNKAVANIRQAISEVGGVGNGGHVVVEGHSQGGLILQRALECLSPEERKMIDVVTYGSASMIEEGGLNSARNYVSKHDAVPYFSDPIGCMRGKYSKSSNITFLESNSKPFIDHPFLESYGSVMEAESKRFVDMYGR